MIVPGLVEAGCACRFQNFHKNEPAVVWKSVEALA